MSYHYYSPTPSGGLQVSHPEISILECKPFSSINLNFHEDFI
jgi:hypothetical protein